MFFDLLLLLLDLLLLLLDLLLLLLDLFLLLLDLFLLLLDLSLDLSHTPHTIVKIRSNGTYKANSQRSSFE